MVVHLTTNALLLVGPEAFQKAVYQIHSPGKALVVIEWAFIFLPILFHALLGIVIIRGGLPNTSSYPYAGNVRYTLQRATGMIAFLFIMCHVAHLHGWFDVKPWKDLMTSLGGARFRPFNAGSTLAQAMQDSFLAQVFYLVGVLSCVFHLANGIWSAGIRWGLWTSPNAMRRASIACLVFGIGLATLGVGSWVAASYVVNPADAKAIENKMLESRMQDLNPDDVEHKRSKD